MTLTLSATDWHHLWQESCQNAQISNLANPSDIILEYPQHLAKGYKRHIELRNGITLTLYHYEFFESLDISNKV